MKTHGAGIVAAAIVPLLSKSLSEKIQAVFQVSCDVLRALFMDGDPFTAAEAQQLFEPIAGLLVARCAEMNVRFQEAAHAMIMELMHVASVRQSGIFFREALKPIKGKNPLWRDCLGLCS